MQRKTLSNQSFPICCRRFVSAHKSIYIHTQGLYQTKFISTHTGHTQGQYQTKFISTHTGLTQGQYGTKWMSTHWSKVDIYIYTRKANISIHNKTNMKRSGCLHNNVNNINMKQSGCLHNTSIWNKVDININKVDVYTRPIWNKVDVYTTRPIWNKVDVYTTRPIWNKVDVYTTRSGSLHNKINMKQSGCLHNKDVWDFTCTLFYQKRGVFQMRSCELGWSTSVTSEIIVKAQVSYCPSL